MCSQLNVTTRLYYDGTEQQVCKPSERYNTNILKTNPLRLPELPPYMPAKETN